MKITNQNKMKTDEYLKKLIKQIIYIEDGFNRFNSEKACELFCELNKSSESEYKKKLEYVDLFIEEIYEYTLAFPGICFKMLEEYVFIQSWKDYENVWMISIQDGKKKLHCDVFLIGHDSSIEQAKNNCVKLRPFEHYKDKLLFICDFDKKVYDKKNKMNS